MRNRRRDRRAGTQLFLSLLIVSVFFAIYVVDRRAIWRLVHHPFLWLVVFVLPAYAFVSGLKVYVSVRHNVMGTVLTLLVTIGAGLALMIVLYTVFKPDWNGASTEGLALETWTVETYATRSTPT